MRARVDTPGCQLKMPRQDAYEEPSGTKVLQNGKTVASDDVERYLEARAKGKRPACGATNGSQ